jgi:type III polyketide synthase
LLSGAVDVAYLHALFDRYNNMTLIRMQKVLSINRFTGIELRSTIATEDHPIINQPKPPTIDQLNTIFLEESVKLSVNACRRAIEESGVHIDEITHVVSTTCTNSANPGFDHYVCKELGLRSNVEKILLHGIGCSGGLAGIRTAANLALGLSYRRKPARILVLACEITSLLVRSELDSIHVNQEVRIGVCLFADCASACIVSNNIGLAESTKAVYNLLGWKHDVLEDTESDLGFVVDPMGKLTFHFQLIDWIITYANF